MSKYCIECGKKLADNALSCPECGYSFKTVSNVNRNKVTAILLAVFVGIFSWCYTYKYDAWKFWLNLVLCILSLGLWGFVAWFWVIIDQCIKSEELFNNY